MKHRPSITEYPLVWGGQGRSGEELTTSAKVITWLFVAVLIAAGIGLIWEVL